MRILRLAGIDVYVHPSWVVSIALLAAFAHSFIVEDLLRGAGAPARAVVSALFALPIAACILAHEFGHSLVARAYGLRVRRITLFAFGGVSQIERDAPGPAAEFNVALAGPLVSLVLASICAGISRALNPGINGLFGIPGAFAVVNFMLAVFNLVPAFPMDGGRILRSALWALTSRAKATRLAAAGGRLFGVALVVGGVVLMVPSFGGGGANGLYVVFMGAFLYAAAGAAGRGEGGER